jgi:hypothetical protein
MSRSLDSGTSRSDREQSQIPQKSIVRGRSEDRTQQNKTIYHFSSRSYHLNAKQETMLQDIGTFRTITAESLQKHVYRNNEDSMEKDLRNLRDLKLVTVRRETRGKDLYVSLTKAGKRFSEDQLRTNNAQALYSGIVKRRELRHDAAIYELYHKEAQDISGSGGTVKRVVLDFELKKNVNRQLAQIQNLAPAERELQRQQIAEEHGLKIVNDTIQIPDLRMEYESREQEECRVDLECVTSHYKSQQIAAKKAAGFKLYNQDYRGRSAERGEDLMGEVMSL